jgi:choline-sulfatase
VRLLRTLLLCLLASPVSASGPAPLKTAKPDVFLITIDTLRADHVRCYGYEHIQTPALDSLAHDGIRFVNAFTPSPITNTSHTSILTGLLPSHHGVTDFGLPLSSAHPTWAELIRGEGYRTAAFIGAVILDSHALAPGLDRGFDFYDNFPLHSSAKSRWGRLERRGMNVVQRTETWLNAHPNGPHFIWMHLYDPHDPYEPPPPYSEIYKDHLYDGEIAYADFALASFVAYLKRHGKYENAIIIVVGDHGEGLGDHDEDTHGVFLYDSTTHVPCILKLPSRNGRRKLRVVTAQVRTIDLLPTVLDLVGAASAPIMDGHSLQPLLSGEETSQRIVFGETDYPLRFGWAPLRSVRAEGFKFIEAPRPELYNLQADSAELHNTYAPWDEPTKKLRTLLAGLHAQSPPAKSLSTVGEQTAEELEALGYLGQADVGSATNVPEPSLLPDPKDKIEEQNLLHAAMIALEDDRIPAAREPLQRVLQLDPKSSTALRQLGELELRSGDDAKAAEYLQAARELHPEDATLAFLAGQAMEKTGDLQGAGPALDTSLKINPAQLAARLLLGRVYMRSGTPAKAQDQFEAALVLQGDNEEAILGLSEAEIEQGRNTDALHQLASLERSRSPKVFDLQARALALLGKPEESHRAEARAQQLRRLQSKTQPTPPR